MPPTSTTPPSATSESPAPPSAATRARLSRQGRRDTTPELALRRELHRRGHRYWVDKAPLPGLRRRADLVFPRLRVAVYVDGCFWHRCPEHGNVPRANGAYWQPKLERNVARDRAVDAALSQAGWRVLRAWEHELPAEVADRVVLALERL